MRQLCVLAAILVALMALLSAPVKGQEKIIAGLRPGYSTLSGATEERLEKTVVGYSPATEAVRLTGLTDTLGWANTPQSEWDEADTALAHRRVNAFAAWYQSRGWQVEIAGIETQTPYRGVGVEIGPREFSLRTAPTATAEVVTTVVRDTCCCDSAIADLANQQKKMEEPNCKSSCPSSHGSVMRRTSKWSRQQLSKLPSSKTPPDTSA